MLIGILVAVAVLLAVVAVIRWKRRATAGSRRVSEAAGERLRLFYGGVLSEAVTTSGLLVRLEILDWGVRLTGSIWSKWLVPTWEARFDELAIAERVATPFSRIAVWFRLRDDAGGIGFLCDTSEEILRVLEQHEVPVNRSVAQIRKVAELYRTP